MPPGIRARTPLARSACCAPRIRSPTRCCRAIRGPVRRVPGLGVVVKDAALLRGDADEHRAASQGRPGRVRATCGRRCSARACCSTWRARTTSPCAASSAPLFAPAFVDALVADGARRGAAPTRRGASRAGERVDLVAHARARRRADDQPARRDRRRTSSTTTCSRASRRSPGSSRSPAPG